MHAISSYRGNRPTNTQTGPIAIHCAAKLSAQCNKNQHLMTRNLMRWSELPFDFDSTVVRLVIKVTKVNTPLAADPLAAVTLTYLFIYLGRSAAVRTQVGQRS